MSEISGRTTINISCANVLLSLVSQVTLERVITLISSKAADSDVSSISIRNN